MVGEHDEGERGDEVVDVDGLHRRGRAPHPERRAAQEQPAREPLGADTEDGGAAQGGHHDTGMLVAPVGEQPFDLGGLHRRREPRVRAQRRVLGERHRVVRPRPVDRGVRDSHHLADPDRGRGIEHPAGAVDVDAGHERLVGDRVDDGREVDEHVGALEQRLELGAGHVDEVELEGADPPPGWAHVEADEAGHGAVRGEDGQEPLPDDTRRARDGDRWHVPRLAAWLAVLNLATSRHCRSGSGTST